MSAYPPDSWMVVKPGLAGLFSMTKISKHTRLPGLWLDYREMPGFVVLLELHVPLFPLRRFASCSHHPLRSLPFVMVRSPFTPYVLYIVPASRERGFVHSDEAQQTKQI